MINETGVSALCSKVGAKEQKEKYVMSHNKWPLFIFVNNGETSRTKNISTESYGGKEICLWVEEKCIFTEKCH
jgi:hypothetical protein